ncbi:hypothetical protein NW754_013616 [Fusarium falciforme]|nr:hypothetical protein NW754_013616 [Fusarium falciforme]
MDLAGRNVHGAFDHTVELKQVVRQQGDSQAPFRDAPQGLRKGKPTSNHRRFLCSRVQSKLTAEEIAIFGNSARIYPTNQQVRDFNRGHMEQLRQPAIQTHASHRNDFGKDAGNLHKFLALCVGVRAMQE